jgi:polysaccharide biosynthesis/export protein
MMKHILLKLLTIGVLGMIPVIAMGQSPDYRVGPDDVLKITVIGKQDYKLQEELTVTQHGAILLSIMKESFDVDGMTLAEIDAGLKDILSREYLVEPEVVVEISKYQSHKILVIGEVKNPGELALEKDNLPIKELMLLTGGPVGDMSKNIMILKVGSDAPAEPVVVPLDEMLMGSDFDNVVINANDIIYVMSKDRSLPMHDLNTMIYVFGEVTKPGIVSYQPNLTVLRAIINAGNFTKEAAPSRTTIKRREAKKLVTVKVNLDAVMSGGDKTQDITLKPGDVIYVPRAIF